MASELKDLIVNTSALQELTGIKIDPKLVNKFSTLAEQWEREVEGMSSTTRMSQHPAYQEIIQMGTQIVPLLLQQLKQNPLYWLSAGDNRGKSHQTRTTRAS